MTTVPMIGTNSCHSNIYYEIIAMKKIIKMTLFFKKKGTKSTKDYVDM